MGKLADIVVTITDMAVENTHVIASEMKSPLAILTSLFLVSRRIQDRRTINNLKENVITLQDIMNHAQNKYLSADEFKIVHSELLERLQNMEKNHKKKYFSDEVKDLLILAKFGNDDAIEGLMDIQHQQEDALQFVISGNSLGIGIESLLEDRRICTPMPAGSLYFSPGKIHILSDKDQIIYRAKPYELGIALKMQNEMMQKFGKEHRTLEEISLAGEVSFGVGNNRGSKEGKILYGVDDETDTNEDLFYSKSDQTRELIERYANLKAVKVVASIRPAVEGEKRAIEQRLRQEGIDPQRIKPKRKQLRAEPSTSEFALEETREYYVFRNVLVNGTNYDISWTKHLLSDGEKKAQDEWMDYCKSKADFLDEKKEIFDSSFPREQIPSLLIYYASLRNLFVNQDSLDDNILIRVREMFHRDFRDYLFMTTSTRFRYKVSGSFEVVHDYKSKNPDVKRIAHKENAGWIKDIKPLTELNAIFGSDNISEINAVFEWIMELPVYFFLGYENEKDEESFLPASSVVTPSHVLTPFHARGVVLKRV